jgi:hypothetical protein
VLFKNLVNLDEHQQLLMAASDMLIEIYILKVLSLNRETGKESRRYTGANSNGKIILVSSGRYRYSKEKKVFLFVEGDEQRMMLMGLRRFTKYTNMPNIVGLRETITKKLVSENEYCF